MKVRLKLFLVAVAFVLIAVCWTHARSFPVVPQAAVDELGVEYGIPKMSGFVFIEGRYIPPPYTVTRRGNGIFINRIQVEQPVPWSYFHPETIAPPEKKVPAVEAAPTNSFETAEEKNAAVKKEASDNILSIDDLFGDDEQVSVAVEEKQNKVETLDDLFGDDGNETSAPQKKNPAQCSTVVRVPEKLSPEQIRERKALLKKQLNEQRAFYERAVAKGELYFFGTMHNKINGTYGSARALFEVLPSALRYSQSPADLLRRLQQGDVYFVDIGVCQALYRHKTTFPLLQQRLNKIKLDEAVKETNRKN